MLFLCPNMSFVYNLMLIAFDIVLFFQHFFHTRLVRRCSKKLESCFVLSPVQVCHCDQQTGHYVVFFIFFFAPFFVECPLIECLSVYQTHHPHSTGEGPCLHFLYSSDCCCCMGLLRKQLVSSSIKSPAPQKYT